MGTSKIYLRLMPRIARIQAENWHYTINKIIFSLFRIVENT